MLLPERLTPVARGIGNDIIEIHRINGIIERYGKRFLDRVFTAKEQEYCFRHRDSAMRFAGRFAAKEAIAKALGTGFHGINWLDIEIASDEKGKPYIISSEKLQERFNNPEFQVSISHTHNLAAAVALWL